MAFVELLLRLPTRLALDLGNQVAPVRCVERDDIERELPSQRAFA